MSGLPYPEWRDTLDTLHMWTQVVGKIQLALAPPVNHWWHIAQHVTARGVTTGPLPHGERTFQIDLDFVEHECRIVISDGGLARLPLQPMAVAVFHDRLVAALDEHGLHVDFWKKPVEVQEAIAFDQDRAHRSYDADRVTGFFEALSGADRILRRFRGEFIGKSSPVHFFWGSFDLAVSRFSGRSAPPHPGGFPNVADWVTREAYSHEVFSAGWWPGSEAYPRPAFYAYVYPEPDGFADAQVPSGAYHPDLSEFVLPWPMRAKPVRARRTCSHSSALPTRRPQTSAAGTGASWSRSERGFPYSPSTAIEPADSSPVIPQPLTDCPLCAAPDPSLLAEAHGRRHYECPRCRLVAVSPTDRPGAADERARYEMHENDPADPAYRAFLDRLASPLMERLPAGAAGLDYGSGPGPALSRMLGEAGHHTAVYDPFFAPDRAVLSRTYDFITCTETAEHFHAPREEFRRLDALLRPGGWLGLMTEVRDASQPFESWWYARDPTHVCFYAPDTFRWLADHFGWELERPHRNVALFRKTRAEAPER